MKVYRVTLPDELLPSNNSPAFEYGNRTVRFDRKAGNLTVERPMHDNEARAFRSRGLVVEEKKAEWKLKTTPAEYVEKHGGEEEPSPQVAETLALARAILAEKE